MLLRTRLASILAALLIAGSVLSGGGCGEEKTAETVTKKETRTVTNKDKKTKKTGTAPKTAPATPAPAPAPAPATPAPAPAPAAPGPGAGSTDQSTDQANMVALIQSDPYYGYGDTYEVMAYDPYYGTGTVLIAAYYADYTQFTEVYMAKDQYGWYATGDYSYTIP